MECVQTVPAPKPPQTGHGGRILARNSLINFAGQALPLLVGLVTIPYILSLLGTERFGFLTLAWAMFGYFSVFDLGTGRAMIKFVAESLSKDYDADVAPLYWTALLVQTLIALGCMAVVAAAAPMLVSLLNFTPGFVDEARTSLYLLALFPPTILLTGSLRGLLEAAQRFELVNLVKVPATASIFVLPLIGALLGMDLPGILLLMLAARIVVVLAYFLLDLRLFPEIRRRPRLDRGSLGQLWSFGSWLTVSNIMGPVFEYLERFFIASLLSVASLAYYAAPYEMISRVSIIPTSVSTALFPALSGGACMPSRDFLKLYAGALKYLFLIITPVSLLFLAFPYEILNVWLGVDFATRAVDILLVLTALFFIKTFAYIPLTVVHAFGRPDLKAKLDLLMLPVFVGLSLYLLPRFGLIGAAWVKFVVTLLDTVALFVLARHVSGQPLRLLLPTGTRRALALGFGLAAVVLGLKAMPKSLGWDLFLFFMAVAFYLAILFRRVLDHKEKKMVLDWLAGLLKQREHDRAYTEVPATLVYEDQEVRGVIRNISGGGCRVIVTSEEFAKLPEEISHLSVECRFRLRRDMEEFSIKGTVRSAVVDKDVLALGVKFTFFHKMQKDIEEYVNSLAHGEAAEDDDTEEL